MVPVAAGIVKRMLGTTPTYINEPAYGTAGAMRTDPVSARRQYHVMATHPPRGHRSLRVGRRSIVDQGYVITTVAWQRRAVFRSPAAAEAAIAVLADASLWHPGRCLCWVLMPDHWHGLVTLGPGQDLSAVMQKAKGRSSRSVHQRVSLSHPLWEKGFHDHALRHDESTLAAARYIVDNPLRAGLVKRIFDYPYWDAVWLTGPDDLGALDRP